jgi:hypothetical protein
MTINATLQHCTFEDLFKGECDPDSRRIIEDYLRGFAQPNDEGKCIKCGKVQGGLMSLLLGGFEYGLVHGEGRCSGCGWPARANHYIKDAEGKTIMRFRIILQYHPDSVTTKGEAP